jgi:hypothetical protein
MNFKTKKLLVKRRNFSSNIPMVVGILNFILNGCFESTSDLKNMIPGLTGRDSK